MDNTEFICGYRRDFYREHGLCIPIRLGVATHPHMLITGSSGSGKSQALLYLIGKLIQANKEIRIYVCDFKNSEDFSFLEPYSNYYAGQECYKGIMDYYKCFTEVREQGMDAPRHLLIVDEYPAMVNYLQMQDKLNKSKRANNILGAVSEILMLGRGIGFGVWIVTQRADNTLFSNGARDNFMGVIGLGNLSKEQKSMVFPGQELPTEILGAGEGMLLADGHEIMPVKYPLLADAEDWKRHIWEILASGNDTEPERNTD